MKDITKKYTNGQMTIVWKPSLCQHSTICWRRTTGLPQVFNPAIKPWINPLGATTEEMIVQVKKCPSGALSFFMNAEE
ncbi:(4Fe-4S)-binding protein [Pollutibacter soli]|uniref:(4Fe-4S)-binding protein n=1 Tax=Pollutibacter soli TaxID=3034157 RepID=UPI0030140DEA